MIKFNHWQIAYRIKGEKEFRLLPNPSFAWAADPFLIEYKGTIYLFAELFLYKSERNGVIGYCKYQNGFFGEWTVTMDKHWHLSYPNVFLYEDEIYMCPESYQREDVSVYRLIEFPSKWEKVKTFIENEKCVDTTFLEYDGQHYLFTFKPYFDRKGGKLYLGRIKNGQIESEQFITDNEMLSRPGGNIFKENNRYIRVSQDCSKVYGEALVFSEIENVWPHYQERFVKRISVNDICINSKKKFLGLHTYNQIRDLEVIDVKYMRFSMEEYIAQKRVRKVFLNKY